MGLYEQSIFIIFADDMKKGKYCCLIYYYGICLVCLMTMFLWFDYAVVEDVGKTMRIAVALGDSVVIAAPIALLNRRWRIIVPAVIAVIGLFLWANIMYMRYWGTLIEFSLITNPASYNSFVFKSLPALLKWGDIVYLITIAAPLISFRLLKVASAPKFPLQKGILVLGLSILTWILAQSATVVYSYNYWKSVGRNITVAECLEGKLRHPEFSRSFAWRLNGIFMYLYHGFSSVVETKLDLDDNQKNDIKKLLNDLGKINGKGKHDQIFAANRHKNLLFIVVESLNAPYVGREWQNHRLTPVLDSLINSQGTISCLNVVAQVKDGSSSDGQLLYNTGLLPLQHGAAAMKFPDNKYKSLATAMGYANPTELIVEEGGFWNHRFTSLSYNYSRLIDNIRGHGMSDDAMILKAAADMLAKAPKPFMVEITTLTMHHPFATDGFGRTDWIDDIPDMGMLERNYCQTLHEFDRALGEFIEALKKSGVFDDTVIVIASDHDKSTDAGNMDIRQPIAFIALNTGISEAVKRTVGQCDVYPTVLEIMGRGDYGWQGLGMSILNPRNNSAVDSEGKLHGTSGAYVDSVKREAWRISDMMIRSNYFSEED